MAIKFLTLVLSLFLFTGTPHYESTSCDSKLQKEGVNRSNRHLNKEGACSPFPAEMMPFAQSILLH